MGRYAGKICDKGEPLAREMGSFRADSHRFLTSWTEVGLGKHHPPILSQERVPSEPHPSGILATADKSFNYHVGSQWDQQNVLVLHK